MPASIDGYKIYRSNFLSGYSRPLVFVARSECAPVGIPMIRIESIIVHPAGPTQIEAVTIDKRYLPRGEPIEQMVETMAETALDRAEDALEKLTGQGVLLEEIVQEKFLACCRREGWAERWQEIISLTYCDPLRTLLQKVEDSPLHRIAEWKTTVAHKR